MKEGDTMKDIGRKDGGKAREGRMEKGEIGRRILINE